MKELSLNLLDIAQNSLSAGASLVEIAITASRSSDRLEIAVIDNGCGMTEEQVRSVIDPFYTTRTTRKIGLGVPLFRMAAQQAGGDLKISSQPGKGTRLSAYFTLSSVDRMPLGDLKGTLLILVRMNESVDFLYTERLDDREMIIDTRELREVLGDVRLDDPDVIDWISGYYDENSPFVNENY